MYIFFDTETGGIPIEMSLLTAFFLVTNDNLDPVGELSLALKPDDGIYRVQASALAVNQINLAEHDKVAITYSEGGTFLWNFLHFHSEKGAKKLTPVGHNVAFDIRQIQDKLVKPKAWENLVSYRTLDTGIIAQFFKLIGYVDIHGSFNDVSGSLSSLAARYGITPQEVGLTTFQVHNAEFDTKLTRGILKRMHDDLIEKL